MTVIANDPDHTQPDEQSVGLQTRDGAMSSVAQVEVRRLSGQLDGHVVQRDDPTYDVERRVWNGMIDRRPAMIAKCASTTDVQRVLTFAAEHDAVISVRGGGHNAAGLAVRDDGIVVDLADIDHVDVDTARGLVRAGGGVTIGALDAATQRHGLAVPLGVVTETGIAGLTLGGGFGWLRNKYGLSCDNLVAATVVTADGRIVRADETDEPELLWGLRGGGGNFGVVTEFEFRAYPLGPEVHFSVVMHSQADAPAALRFFREWSERAPDEVSSIGVVWHAPEIDEIAAEHHGTPIATFVAMHSGTPAEGAEVLAELEGWGSPIANLGGTMPYLEVQQFFDEDYPKWERRYYWTSSYVRELADELIDAVFESVATMPAGHSNVDIWPIGGAVARVDVGATAFGDRSASFMLGIEANWDDPDLDQAHIEWAQRIAATAGPWSTGGRYANFPGGYETDEAPDFFGGNGHEVEALKRRFDPDNRFDRTHT
ncbi:MAG: FAD-binding oxidoreductase [Actinomycetota bacterium]